MPKKITIAWLAGMLGLGIITPGHAGLNDREKALRGAAAQAPTIFVVPAAQAPAVMDKAQALIRSWTTVDRYMWAMPVRTRTAHLIETDDPIALDGVGFKVTDTETGGGAVISVDTSAFTGKALQVSQQHRDASKRAHLLAYLLEQFAGVPATEQPPSTVPALALPPAAPSAGPPQSIAGICLPARAGGRDESALPAPPPGFRWQPVPALSDEFSGKSWDTAKWQPQHPYWAGREPSRFDPANVFVNKGALLLRSTSSLADLSSVPDPTKDIWVQAACLASKAPLARYGYYEARLKASDLSMTSSFWLQGKYSEIDVVEELGGSLKNPGEDRQMLSNTHYFRDGWTHDIATPRRADMAMGAAEAYHTYGVWWKDADTVIFYLDGQPVQKVKTGGPFQEPMYLFFDTEVFIWEGMPTLDSLRDPRRNVMSVDWVRAWTLAPATSKNR